MTNFSISILVFLAITYTVIILSSMFYRKALIVIIPLTFVLCFGITYQSATYQGYAISYKFVPDSAEGVIIQVNKGRETIVVMLWFPVEGRFRLVEFPLTMDNEKEIDGRQENSVLKFGKPTNRQGAAEQGESGEQPDFEIKGYSESELGKKV